MQIAIDDTKFDVIATGSGDAVVLLHGFPFSHDIWKSQIERLKQNHFVIAPDLRGLGKSAVTAGPYLMEMLAGDVAATLDSLGIERAAVVGHSLGGYVALAFFRMFSERVERFALVCSRLDGDTPQAAQNRLALADRAEREGIAPVVERFMAMVFAAETGPQIRSAAREIMERTDPLGAAGMLRGMAQRVDSGDLIEEFSIPVMIVAGGKDVVAPPQEWRRVLPEFANARLEVCERSAHMPMLEEPERLSETLANFLR